jgi:hypothetical protein
VDELFRAASAPGGPAHRGSYQFLGLRTKDYGASGKKLVATFRLIPAPGSKSAGEAKYASTIGGVDYHDYWFEQDPASKKFRVADIYVYRNGETLSAGLHRDLVCSLPEYHGLEQSDLAHWESRNALRQMRKRFEETDYYGVWQTELPAPLADDEMVLVLKLKAARHLGGPTLEEAYAKFSARKGQYPSPDPAACLIGIEGWLELDGGDPVRRAEWARALLIELRQTFGRPQDVSREDFDPFVDLLVRTRMLQLTSTSDVDSRELRNFGIRSALLVSSFGDEVATDRFRSVLETKLGRGGPAPSASPADPGTPPPPIAPDFWKLVKNLNGLFKNSSADSLGGDFPIADNAHGAAAKQAPSASGTQGNSSTTVQRPVQETSKQTLLPDARPSREREDFRRMLDKVVD